MSTEAPEINPPVDAKLPLSLVLFIRQLLYVLIRPFARVRVTETGTGDPRAIRLQVINRRDSEKSGAFVVLVWIATAAGGAPNGTQTVALVTGTLLQTITANKCLMYLTDASGKIDLTVALGGAGTRYVLAVVLGEGLPSAKVVWT